MKTEAVDIKDACKKLLEYLNAGAVTPENQLTLNIKYVLNFADQYELKYTIDISSRSNSDFFGTENLDQIKSIILNIQRVKDFQSDVRIDMKNRFGMIDEEIDKVLRETGLAVPAIFSDNGGLKSWKETIEWQSLYNEYFKPWFTTSLEERQQIIDCTDFYYNQGRTEKEIMNQIQYHFGKLMYGHKEIARYIYDNVGARIKLKSSKHII